MSKLLGLIHKRCVLCQGYATRLAAAATKGIRRQIEDDLTEHLRTVHGEHIRRFGGRRWMTRCSKN